jgi:hypothetical protein
MLNREAIWWCVCKLSPVSEYRQNICKNCCHVRMHITKSAFERLVLEFAILG